MSSTEQVVREVVRGELVGVVQIPRLTVRMPSLLFGPRGRGGAIVVMPGRSADDISTAPLRAYLRALGHRPVGWGLGVNHGRMNDLLPLAVDRVADIAELQGGPIALVGQSMGGYVAREVARRRPDLVDRIVTLGTPIFAPQSRGAITCPVTAIYSRADRIVGTGRSIDSSPATDNVEVHSTHLAMGVDPDVWKVVAEALADQPTTAAADG